MKITGTSSYIKIEYDGKTLKVNGEMFVGGFVAYINTMKWEPPHENELLDEKLKKEIISAVVNQTKDKDFRIEFE